MKNWRLEDYYYKLKLIGIYQIAGGVLGIALFIWYITLLEDKPWPSSVYTLLIVAFTLFINSIFWGMGLCYKKQYAINASIILQLLQIFNFTFLNHSLRFVSGLGISPNFNFTNGLSFDVNFNASIVQFMLTTQNEKIIGINLVAAFLLFCLIRLKENILEEREILPVAG